MFITNFLLSNSNKQIKITTFIINNITNVMRHNNLPTITFVGNILKLELFSFQFQLLHVIKKFLFFFHKQKMLENNLLK